MNSRLVSVFSVSNMGNILFDFVEKIFKRLNYVADLCYERNGINILGNQFVIVLLIFFLLIDTLVSVFHLKQSVVKVVLIFVFRFLILLSTIVKVKNARPETSPSDPQSTTDQSSYDQKTNEQMEDLTPICNLVIIICAVPISVLNAAMK